MIPRYERPEISTIWATSSRYHYLLKVELAIIQALEDAHRIPVGITKQISSVQIDPQRINEIEAEVHHDVIAFTTSITEQLPPSIGKFFHFGVTSSDILDTALNLQLRDSLQIISQDFNRLFVALEKAIQKSDHLLCLGRSHGIYAEPMIMAQKWLSFVAEFKRRYRDLENFIKYDLHAQFSGAVGNYTILTPEIEQRAASILNLTVEPISTQVIPRDYLAKLISISAQIGTAIERMAIEIRHLQHSDVNEVLEGFSQKQKGSSTMPHKKNPISSENLSGIARILRSHLSIALDNCLLWHERDISHSSAERIYLPDALGLLSYAINRLSITVNNLVFNDKHIENKILQNDQFLSSFYLHYLIEHSELSREELYRIVQKASFADGELRDNLTKELIANRIAVKLPSMNFDDLKKHYRQIYVQIYQRVKESYDK